MLLLGTFLFLLPLAVLFATFLIAAGLVRFYFQRDP
jgi:K+-transporting ATPase A subunit